jgi:hypothetical protein
VKRWLQFREWVQSWTRARARWLEAEKQVASFRQLNSALVKRGLGDAAWIERLEKEAALREERLWESVPGLTAAEIERLSILAEECGEVMRSVGKVLRFGWESESPYVSRTNRAALEREIGSVRAIVNLMLDADDVRLADVQGWQRVKRAGLAKWTLHQACSMPREEQLAMMAGIQQEHRN